MVTVEQRIQTLLENVSIEEDQQRLDISKAIISDGISVDRASTNGYSIFGKSDAAFKANLVADAKGNYVYDRIMGSIMGMAVGDTLGHAFEFLPTVDEPNEKHFFDLETMTFHGEYNKFKLKRGQWTDDCSMGLCMADSFIVRKVFDGSDMRIRFWFWWNRGYNNAFRLDPTRDRSVGLGGNICMSLMDVEELAECGESVPPAYGANGEDAGNGSLMRFTPVAIFGSRMPPPELNAIARQSSYTTHPGIMAAEACSLLGYLIRLALDRSQDSTESPKDFLERATKSYIEIEALDQKSGWGWDQMNWLVKGEPVNETERCWRWRSPRLDIDETLRARGSRYNGYPVSAGYFGSFCMDGMALAMWSFYHTDSFDAAVTRSINLLGDADSHGSITGQLAGAFYGYSSIHPTFVQWVNEWDVNDIACRGLVLHHLAPCTATAAAPLANDLSRARSDAAAEDVKTSDTKKLRSDDQDDAAAIRGALAELGEELDESQGFAVYPKTFCPHLKGTLPAHTVSMEARCSECGEDETWICGTCGVILCSRYKNQHMLKHSEAEGHAVGLSLSDLSFWCFKCDSYLDVFGIPALHPLYTAAHLAKFGTQPPLPASSSCDASPIAAASSSSSSSSAAGPPA